MRCETGEFPIKIIQGDSYRRVYKFYDTDGNVMDNSVISSVILSVSRLNYTQTLNWNAAEEGYVFILSADTTAEFPYCKGTYDVTLNFRDTQVSTQVYQSSWQIFEKDVFYNTITNNNGYMTCENSEVVIKTGITVSAGGGGIPEAPIDGKQYARKDGAWAEVQSGGSGGTPTLDADGVLIFPNGNPSLTDDGTLIF